MPDRILTISFAISFAAHLALLLVRGLPLLWFRTFRPMGHIEVIYDLETAQREVQRLEEQLIRARRESATVAPATGLSERAQIRIPDRPALLSEQDLAGIGPMPSRTSVVDLTNLVEAAGGNPVLLSYFSVIRERIQDTANQRAWFTGDATQGLVYVSFSLLPSGAVAGVGVVTGKSVASRTLQEAALSIVTHAAPFPPFPPSMREPSKTVVVPLEFLLGS